MAGSIVRKSMTGAAEKVVKGLDPEGLIDGLVPGVQPVFRALVVELAVAGFGMVRVCAGWRSLTAQQRYYGLGRTPEQCVAVGVPGEFGCAGVPQVTWTLPEDSLHVAGRAIDLDVASYQREDVRLWGGIARVLRLVWGGSWSVDDWCHFEWRS